MASFFAYDFEFDDIPSHLYDLKIVTFGEGGLFSGVGSTDVNIITQRVLRKSKPYYLGRTQEPVLSFPITFGSYREISGLDRDRISAWLFGRTTYKKLYILQDDLHGAYFNCFLTKPEPQYIGALNYAISCEVVCDSPWAYLPERTISGTSLGSTAKAFTVYNNSSEDEYLYPTVNFTIPTSAPLGGINSFTLINTSDSDRTFEFTELYPEVVISVDNDLQIVQVTTSQYVPSTATLGIGNFNKQWFRMIPGANALEVYSDATDYVTYEIKMTERMKIGG